MGSSNSQPPPPTPPTLKPTSPYAKTAPDNPTKALNIAVKFLMGP